MSSLHTPGFAHYSVAWSPFHESRLAVSSAANFGLIGNGRLHLLSLAPNSTLALDKFYKSQDGLFDLAWSEIHENQIVTASGDGSLRLWDVTLNDLPIRIWQEHSREAFSVDWSNISKETFCSSSWDGTVKLWTPERPHSVFTLQASQSCVYQASFSPHQPDLIACAAADGLLRLFDLRAPNLLTAPTSLTSPVSTPALIVPPRGPGELLSLDWNKYRPFVLATGGTDKSIRIWDCRMVKSNAGVASDTPVVGATHENEFLGHEYAVRKLQWCPHRADLLASASYDMTCRIWSTNPPQGRTPLMQIYDAHTEFVAGCSWALFQEGLIASCGWDSKVNLFHL